MKILNFLGFIRDAQRMLRAHLNQFQNKFPFNRRDGLHGESATIHETHRVERAVRFDFRERNRAREFYDGNNVNALPCTRCVG